MTFQKSLLDPLEQTITQERGLHRVTGGSRVCVRQRADVKDSSSVRSGRENEVRQNLYYGSVGRGKGFGYSGSSVLDRRKTDPRVTNRVSALCHL